MNAIFLKLRFLSFLTFLLSCVVQAQQARFIYIQTENKQPFYVKMDKRILSSSASGYIIIAKLIDSTYKLFIGFPQNQWPEMNVAINLKENHAGLLLKNYGKGDWGMVNLQNNQLQVMQVSPSPIIEVEVIPSEDEFAKILAAIVNDPSIAEVTVMKKTEIAIKPNENKANETVISDPVINSPPVNTPLNDTLSDKSEITKLAQNSTTEGLYLTYLDKENTKGDTISVFLPDKKEPITVVKHIETEIKDTIAKQVNTVKNDSRFIDMQLQNPNTKTDSAASKKDDFVITEKKVAVNNQPDQNQDTTDAGTYTDKVMINSDCKKNASQNDFLKLRKQMAAQSTEKNMLIAAYKQFINTCFTTEQVKNLGVLFITQEEKYKFFVAAFPFVSDTHNFGTLDDQLSDNYYKTRFKAMLSR